jgi:hypothetical protein
MQPFSGASLNDPADWRERAKQLRADAGAASDREQTRLLLELAQMHDQFAADIEARQSQAGSLHRMAQKDTDKNERHADK